MSTNTKQQASVGNMKVPILKDAEETRKKAIVEYLDCQIPVTQLIGPKGNGDMQAAKRD